MKLSKRLEAIASFIPDSGGVIDVGCNHAYICIFIALKGKERKTFTEELKKGVPTQEEQAKRAEGRQNADISETQNKEHDAIEK